MDDAAILSLPWPAADKKLVAWFLENRERMMRESKSTQEQINIAGLYTLVRRGPFDRAKRHKDTIHHENAIGDLRSLKDDAEKFHESRRIDHLFALANWNPNWHRGPRRTATREGTELRDSLRN